MPLPGFANLLSGNIGKDSTSRHANGKPRHIGGVTISSRATVLVVVLLTSAILAAALLPRELRHVFRKSPKQLIVRDSDGTLLDTQAALLICMPSPSNGNHLLMQLYSMEMRRTRKVNRGRSDVARRPAELDVHCGSGPCRAGVPGGGDTAQRCGHQCLAHTNRHDHSKALLTVRKPRLHLDCHVAYSNDISLHWV